MHRIAFAIASILSIFLASPASAQVVITQAKALAGNVTPGDTAGYPITLSQPGAYILGSNLSVPSGTYGIYAGVDNIDIDLNGFTISGGGVATYALVTPKAQGSIHGGVIKAFRSSGLYIRGDAWTIEDMKIVQNGGMGIDAVDAKLITLQNSLVAVNSDVGIYTGDFGFFKGNKIANNKYYGIFCKLSCHVEGNMVSITNGAGIVMDDGFAIGNTLVRNSREGLIDNGSLGDTGYTNNMFIGNNPTGSKQVSGVGVVVDPNSCVGKPCTAP